MNNKITLFEKVDSLSNTSDKETEIYKGKYHKYKRISFFISRVSE